MSELNLFTDMLKIELCLAQNTIDSYISDIKQFIKWKNSDPINKHDLYKYVHYLTPKMKNSTIKRKITSISIWIKFMNTSLIMDTKVEIPKIKKEKKIPNLVSDEEFAGLRNFHPQCIQDIRNKAIIETLYSTGLRVSELVSLKYEQVKNAIKGNKNSFVITGKGQKDRIVFLSSESRAILNNYCNRFNIKSGYLWGKSGKPITRQGVYFLINELGKKVGIPKLTPHAIRHKLATNLVQNGMELVAVQKLLGHSNVNTTSIYVHMCNKDTFDAVNKYHRFGKGS